MRNLRALDKAGGSFQIAAVSLDPYAPPAGDLLPQRHRLLLREIVLAWEKLRLIYNALLALPGLGVLWFLVEKGGLPWEAAVLDGVGVAIGANACFFAGPLAEMYLRALFGRDEGFGRGRQLLFGLGLLVSAGAFVVMFIVMAVGLGVKF